MATLKGLQLKKIVEFKGHEQEPLFQCDLWYKGKKVGFFSQDAWGGEDNIDAPKEVHEAFATYSAMPSVGYDSQEYKDIFKGLGWAVQDLYNLTQDEKRFVKANKEIPSALTIVTHGYRSYAVTMRLGFPLEPSEIIAKIKAKFPEYQDLPPVAFKVYRTIKDFYIE